MEKCTVLYYLLSFWNWRTYRKASVKCFSSKLFSLFKTISKSCCREVVDFRASVNPSGGGLGTVGDGTAESMTGSWKMDDGGLVLTGKRNILVS